MDDPILIAKLASKIQIARDDDCRLLGFPAQYIADSTGVELPPEEDHQWKGVHWTLKAEAALRVMLAKEILNAAHK